MGVFDPHVRLHANPFTLPYFNKNGNILHTCLQCRPEASLAKPCSLELLIQEDKYLPKNYTEGVICVCFMNLIMFVTYGHMLDAKC